jgi:hypothetical protein
MGTTKKKTREGGQESVAEWQSKSLMDRLAAVAREHAKEERERHCVGDTAPLSAITGPAGA